MDMTTENPFADLMSKAVKLKGAQQAQLRTHYDAWPQYFQHSLFMQESVLSVRKLPFDERLAAAQTMKAAGNAHYSADRLEEAVAEYEKALAIFKFLENKDPGWKKKGIEDGDMLVTDFKCDNAEDQARLDTLEVACYLNIAVSKFRLKEYAVCIQACDDTLALDPRNVKALYRRAQALITPASSGALEFDRAISDLQQGYNIDPENRGVRKLLRELKDQRTKQRALDRQTFTGMFDRGHVYDSTADTAAPPDEAAREQQFAKEVEEAEVLARAMEAKGKDSVAKEIRDRIKQAQQARARRLKRVDFFNPTPDMIKDAKNNGIDLTDRSTQQMLHDLQEEERTKTSSGSGMPCTSTSASPGAVDSVESLLKSMSRTEITELLTREGIDPHEISGREQLLETAREVLLAKLESSKQPDGTPYVRTVVLLAIAWTLLRLYTSGGLSTFTRIFANVISGGSASDSVNQALDDTNLFDD